MKQPITNKHFHLKCFLRVLLLTLGLDPVQSLRGGLQNNDSDQILECDIRIARFLSPTFSETRKGDQISCVVNEMVYDIPNAILEQFEEELRAPGAKRMLIEGGSLPSRGGYASNALGGEIIYPPDASVIFINERSDRRLQGGLGSQRKKGSSNVLVVRVIAKDASTTLSAETLYDRIFGDGSKVINLGLGDSGTLRQTYLDCSFGQLSFEPAQGYDIVNGVGFVELDMEIQGVSNRVVENSMTYAINEKYGSVDDWDHIIYCIPKGTTGPGPWVAFGYGDWYRTVYNDEFCGQNSALVHEVGHNIGLQHSNEGEKYADQTCMVGFSYNWMGGPRMCFNAHKNWVLGWYEDKSIEINPSIGPWGGTLVGFVDYEKATTNEYIVVHFLDIYMQYNRAKGFNRQVIEKWNQLVIIHAEGDDKPSESLAGLNQGEVFEYQGYVIKFCQKGTGSNSKDYILISVHPSGESDVCGTNTGPQMMPSFAPTLISSLPPDPAPTSEPTQGLTPKPTPSGTLAMTGSPSRSPTAFLSSKPTPALTSKPTPAATFATSSSPSGSPSEFLSLFPTGKKTTTPTSWPPQVPSYDLCDDTRGEFYVASLSRYETCVWLKARPKDASVLCEEGNESGARKVCPETCRVCMDDCYDNIYAPVVINGTSRNCIWLDLRPDMVKQECVVGTDSWSKCRETCGNCNTSPTGAPSGAPSTASPSISPEPTLKNPFDSCDDDRYATFYVNETNKEEPCRWLHGRAAMRQIYCNESHPAGAYSLCEETCEKCSDECTDDPGKPLNIGGISRSCSYIAGRMLLMEQLCVEGEDAYLFCGETCDSCTAPSNTSVGIP